MLRRTIFAVGAATCAFAITSCAAETPAPDSNPAPHESETQPPDAQDPALKIEKPKDLKSITDACSVLTPEQLTTLQQDGEGKGEDTVYGESRCRWFGENYSTTVALGESQDTGPAQLRERAKSADNFKPTEVNGYPGVLVDDQGTMCRAEIGIADDQFFTVSYARLQGKEPEFQKGCEFAEKIASEVLKNIPDAQPK